MKRSAFTVFILLPLLLLSCAALWQSDSGRAIQAARSGEYAEAVRTLEPLVAGGSNDPAAVDALYNAWIRQGEYAKAKERFDAWATARPNSAPIRYAAGRANRLVGNYAAALTHLNAAVNSPDLVVAANFEKANVLEESGKREEAEAIYDRIIQNFLNTPNTPSRNLIYVAGSLVATGKFLDANDVYRTAVKADPKNVDAWVAWGELLTLKYKESDAIENYKEALKVDPNMPEAHLNYSKNLASTDGEKAEEEFKKAIEVNPKLPAAHLFEATQLIESEQYDKAMESINKALAVNPQDVEAFSLAASVYYLQGNTAEFNKYRDKVLATNPQYSKLYYTLAESAVSVRMYKEAVAFAREAVKINPRDYDAMTLLGINLHRIGQEKEGTDILETAFKGDDVNLWAGNTLNLLDRLAADYDRFQTPHFEVKLEKKESAALKPYVTDLLEKAYKTLTAKYNFTPQGPLSFEMFPNHNDFEVRAVGLTGLGALGVCFGNLFVMDSPTARELDHFNWGSTLWHEFTHIITLQMTENRVPRWFSEGLSVFEERKAYPGWGDDMKLDFLKVIKQTAGQTTAPPEPPRAPATGGRGGDQPGGRGGEPPKPPAGTGTLRAAKLLPIAELNDGFMHPKYAGQVLVSYYQASMVAEYIEMKWGFPAILKMLQLYKAQKNTEQVFREALNISLTGFDTEFFKWMGDKTAPIDPSKYGKLLEAGVEALDKGDLDKAIASFKEAVEMYPEYSDDENAWEPLAEAYLKKGDKAAATDTLKKYLTYSELSFPSYVKLSELLEESGDKAGAAKALEGAMYVRPTDLKGHSKLGSLMLELKQYPSAAREFETMIALKTPDRATAYYLLAQSYLGEGKRTEARKAVLSSLDIAPSYEPAQKLLVEILK
jgi:tetratricopeptide (TPR) repeat protein